LTSLGYDHAQGYHLAKPMIVADFVNWYDERGNLNRT